MIQWWKCIISHKWIQVNEKDTDQMHTYVYVCVCKRDLLIEVNECENVS